jgi:Ras-related C3 botulinum toxin substrate 1
MSDEALLKFITTVDWPKYINDRDVKQNVENIRKRITELSNDVKGGDTSKSVDEDTGDIDIAGATRVKLVVVGDGAVGKTSLLISYATNNFPTDYVPTVFENYTARKKRHDDTILLHLWDTAGQEEYDRLRPLSYPGADIVLLCFSTVSQASYDAIRDKWAPEVNHYIPEVPHILVGTKIDLREAQHPDPNSGKFEPITAEMGQSMAKQIKAAKYLEVSSKTRQGLEDVFNQAIDLVLEMRGVPPKGEIAGSDTKNGGTKPPASQKKPKTCIIL